eukprot:Pgem_evm1s9293
MLEYIHAPDAASCYLHMCTYKGIKTGRDTKKTLFYNREVYDVKLANVVTESEMNEIIDIVETAFEPLEQFVEETEFNCFKILVVSTFVCIFPAIYFCYRYKESEKQMKELFVTANEQVKDLFEKFSKDHHFDKRNIELALHVQKKCIELNEKRSYTVPIPMIKFTFE